MRNFLGFSAFIIAGALLIFYLNGQRTFWKAFSDMFIIMMSITWYDAIVVDCIWFCHSLKVIIEGTKDMVKEYRNYKFHIMESLKGSLMSLVVALLTACCVVLYAGWF